MRKLCQEVVPYAHCSLQTKTRSQQLLDRSLRPHRYLLFSCIIKVAQEILPFVGKIYCSSNRTPDKLKVFTVFISLNKFDI